LGVDTDKLNRWLALGANLGVLVGLGLLLIELDQNREMMRAQTRHDIAAGIVDLLLVPASNEQLANLMYRAETGGDLTPEENFQFRMFITSIESASMTKSNSQSKKAPGRLHWIEAKVCENTGVTSARSILPNIWLRWMHYCPNAGANSLNTMQEESCR
jgi:hypothetical protein